jgi:hypothetical protein
MKKAVLLLSLLFFLLFAPMVRPADFAGYDLLVPVAGRTPGALGSEWRTDLYITNADRRSAAPTQSVNIVFGQRITTASVPPRATIVLKDIEGAVGSIRIVSQSPLARITARARIYNVGSPQGEYGQTAQALPVTSLSRETFLPGLSGVDGNRTNIGISNPGSTQSSAFITLYDREGEFRGGFSTVIEPRSLYLLNDVFSHFQAGPLDAATVQVTTSNGVYAYASIIRADTGDADFVTGTGMQIDDSNTVVTPACAAPAPLSLAPIPAKGWIVLYHPGTDAAATTAQLSARHAFTPITVYEHAMQAFHAELTHETIAALRCEPAVKAVEQNQQVPLP